MESINLGTADGLPNVEWTPIAEKLAGDSAPAPDAHNARSKWLATNNEDGRTLTSFVPVIGPHMAANSGAAIVMLLEAGYAWERIVEALERDGGIKAHLPGRAEKIHGEGGPAVYVDFGHTPVGIEKTLEGLRRVTAGKLVVMMGADGSRDTTKRFAMGKAAADYGDIVIITDHNPRMEDPAIVRRMLLEGARSVKSEQEAYEISPPETAIVEAVKLIGPGDALMWFGPGHQDHRDVQGVRLFYSGRELARQALIDAGWPVGERRWNLRLANKLDVRLPEHDVENALEVLTRAEAEDHLFSRDITAIDLRLPDRLTVRLSAEAAKAREDMLNKDKKAKRKLGDA